jgi:hypothetical protein
MIQLVSQKQTRHFQTLSQAIAASREISTDKPRTIILPDGDYFLKETIELNWHDSNLTIKAETSGQAYLIGGQHITGWQQQDDRLWAAPLPQAKTGKWYFRLLVVNGRLAQRSRLPEIGYFLHDTEFNVKWLSTVEGGWERPATDDELLTLNYRPQDIGPWMEDAPSNAFSSNHA